MITNALSWCLCQSMNRLWDKELAANPLNPSLIKCYRQTFGSGMALHQFLGKLYIHPIPISNSRCASISHQLCHKHIICNADIML